MCGVVYLILSLYTRLESTANLDGESRVLESKKKIKKQQQQKKTKLRILPKLRMDSPDRNQNKVVSVKI